MRTHGDGASRRPTLRVPRVPRVVGAVLVTALALGGLTVLSGTAQAAGRVTVSNESGRAEADTSGPTSLTVRGTGFQSVQNAHGGIYVAFGWVDDPAGGSWAPSRGGITGESFRYVPDTEAQDNQGFLRFVAFPGSDTGYAAHGEVAADGSWSVTMTVPGPVLQTRDRDNNVREVNCLEVTCGVITFGAHGVKNANNETFTPVAFTDVRGSGAAASGGGAGSAGAADGGEADEVALPDAPATVGLDATTVVVGRVLGFTGQGFLPGEQVVATLGGGLGAVGPLVAGAHGEVAGVLQLPGDIRVGTHALTLTGAASEQAPAVEFQVVADAVAAAAAANLAEEQAPTTSPAQIAIGVLGLLLLGLLVSSFVTARRRRQPPTTDRRRRPRRGRAAPAAPADAGTLAESAAPDTAGPIAAADTAVLTTGADPQQRPGAAASAGAAR